MTRCKNKYKRATATSSRNKIQNAEGKRIDVSQSEFICIYFFISIFAADKHFCCCKKKYEYVCSKKKRVEYEYHYRVGFGVVGVANALCADNKWRKRENRRWSEYSIWGKLFVSIAPGGCTILNFVQQFLFHSMSSRTHTQTQAHIASVPITDTERRNLRWRDWQRPERWLLKNLVFVDDVITQCFRSFRHTTNWQADRCGGGTRLGTNWLEAHSHSVYGRRWTSLTNRVTSHNHQNRYVVTEENERKQKVWCRRKKYMCE